jgi:hypothetical protein
MARPEFREEKPEGLTAGTGLADRAPQVGFSLVSVNRWLTSNENLLNPAIFAGLYFGTPAPLLAAGSETTGCQGKKIE